MRLTSCSFAFFFLWAAFFAGGSLRVAAASAARFFGSTAVPPPLTGRSRMWPTLDFTTKSLPRYLLIVLAFAGDSTMTSDLLIESIYPILTNIPASEFFGQLPYLRHALNVPHQPVDRYAYIPSA